MYTICSGPERCLDWQGSTLYDSNGFEEITGRSHAEIAIFGERTFKIEFWVELKSMLITDRRREATGDAYGITYTISNPVLRNPKSICQRQG